MTDSLRYCLVLMVALFSSRFHSGTEYVSKHVCQGDYVQLFQNITLISGQPVNLYINGLRKTLISTWHHGQKPFIIEGYKEKVSLDEYGTIWIRNVQRSQNGSYILQYDTDLTKSEVNVNVMVAPKKSCKPKIVKNESFLIASLEENDCGIPVAEVHWCEHQDISYIHKYIVMLPPGKEAGTYCACAKSLALKCAEELNLSDYCSSLTVQGKVPSQETGVEIEKDKDRSLPVSSDITLVVILLVNLVAVTTAVITVIIVIKYRKKKQIASKSANIQVAYSTTLQPPAEVEPMLNGTEDGSDEAATEQQITTDSETRRELQEPPNITHCKICYSNRANMLLLPCRHNGTSYIPICNICSTRVQQCPECIANMTGTVFDGWQIV